MIRGRLVNTEQIIANPRNHWSLKGTGKIAPPADTDSMVRGSDSRGILIFRINDELRNWKN
jgi:hypothetical protein